ncbi:MAG: PaaI family thioesterase [Caldimonas sp.]
MAVADPPKPPLPADRGARSARNPDWQRLVARSFAEAPFVHENGIRLEACAPGWCESSVVLTQHHFQHNGVPHAGLMATLADHTSGVAAISLAAPGALVLTAEFKISLLRAIAAQKLHCRAEVVRPGSQLCFVEASVEAETEGGERKLVARASVTLAVVGADRAAQVIRA